jgi:hypothetical protein
MRTVTAFPCRSPSTEIALYNPVAYSCRRLSRTSSARSGRPGCSGRVCGSGSNRRRSTPVNSTASTRRPCIVRSAFVVAPEAAAPDCADNFSISSYPGARAPCTCGAPWPTCGLAEFAGICVGAFPTCARNSPRAKSKIRTHASALIHLQAGTLAQPRIRTRTRKPGVRRKTNPSPRSDRADPDKHRASAMM